MNPQRCDKCPACVELKRLSPMHMPCPPFTNATTDGVLTWNTEVLRHPCQTWTEEQLELFFVRMEQLPPTIRPREQYIIEERARCHVPA